MTFPLRFACLLLAAVLLQPRPAPAQDQVTFEPVPERLQPGLDHLLGLVGEDISGDFDSRAADGVLHFVATAEPPDGTAYTAGVRKDAASAVHLFDVAADLETILRYAYNPEIPAHLTMPRSTRLNRWKQTHGGEFPEFWRHIDANEPLLVRAIEHEETTPDLFSGAYYAYDLDRTLILTRHEGRRVFISLSRQRGRSEIGRKGLVLGPDKSWDYFYSEEEGLTRRGIGWADTYMYRSMSATIFYELERRRPLVRVGSFKWLDGGWMGINMVKKKHIFAGLRRYAEGLRQVFESPRLPAAEDLAASRDEIAALPMTELRRRYAAHIDRLVASYTDRLAVNDFLELAKADDYAQRMSRAQMEAALLLEKLDSQLGQGSARAAASSSSRQSPAGRGRLNR